MRRTGLPGAHVFCSSAFTPFRQDPLKKPPLDLVHSTSLRVQVAAGGGELHPLHQAFPHPKKRRARPCDLAPEAEREGKIAPIW